MVSASGFSHAVRLVRAIVAGMLAMGACAGTHRVSPSPELETPLIEIRLAYDSAGPNREPLEYAGQTVYLDRRRLFSDSDFSAVKTSLSDAHGLYLILHYSPAAGQRMAATLAEHIGGRVALVIDSRIRNVSVIAAPVGSRGTPLITATTLTGAEASTVAAQVRAKWPQ